MADGPRSEVATGFGQTKLSQRLPDYARNHLVACIGEFVGTTLFLFMGLGGAHIANGYPNDGTARLMYISVAFGLALLVNAWIFYRVSGGLFNPAVTLGMVLVGALPPVRGALVAVTQLVAGIFASALVMLLLPGEMNVSTTLSPGTSVAQGFVLEAILTFQLTMAIFMLAGEKHSATYIAPVGIGLALFVAELAGIPYTGASLNPARSFGPQVVLMSFDSSHWIYWAGPVIGAVVAAGLYKTLQALEYQSANPDQDAASAPTEGAIHLQSDN